MGTIWSHIRASFAALPANEPQSYAAGATNVRDRLGEVFLGLGAALDRLARAYPDRDSNTAFDQQPNCKRLA